MRNKKLLSGLYAATAALTLGAAPAASAYDWTGFYAGGYVAATAFETDTADYWCWYACDAPGDSEIEFSIGAQGGYNWQVGENFVTGIEADIATGAKSSETINYSSDSGVRWKSEWKWLLTVRGRAGLNVNRTMVYVTGGVAFADGDFSAREFYSGDFPDEAKTSKTLTGLVGGAGIEHALTDTLRLKVEVLSIVMPKEEACWRELGDSECWAGENANDDYVHWKTSGTSVRLGLNWNF